MKQEEYTDLVISKLLASFPEFEKYTQIRSDKTADIEYPSERGKLKLFISTRNNEITVGFSAGHNQFGWHIHMDMNGAKTSEGMVEEAIDLINSIKDDKQVIVYTRAHGYFISEVEEQPIELQRENEVVELLYWSEL